MLGLEHYPVLAKLFDFPLEGFAAKYGSVAASLEKVHPAAAAHVRTFISNLPETLDEMQELFVRTFDVQSVTTLDVGYVMFGDDYKRGELLANLNREHKKVGNDCGFELADHLPNLLRLLPQIEDRELVTELARELLYPVIRRMMTEFVPARLEAKKESYVKHYKTLLDVSATRESIFLDCFKALDLVLALDFQLKAEVKPSKPSLDFLSSLVSEMEIEKFEQA